MCGIFSILNNEETFSLKEIENEFLKGKNRGPEFSKLQNVGIKLLFGFHRLAINGIDEISNQPIVDDTNNIFLICNGEIYNYKELYKVMGITPRTNSDCEVIIHLYKKYGIEQTLNMLDGVFSFILYDSNNTQDDLTSKMYVARDPLGVRPLYILESFEKEEFIGFASELKCLSKFHEKLGDQYSIKQFEPGTYSSYELSYKVLSKWNIRQNKKNVRYFIPSQSIYCDTKLNIYFDIDWIVFGIQYYLVESVKKRCLTTERPIACLLSGGLDSSLITALVNEEHKKISNVPLETYSIGLENSEDLKYAKIVADYLGTNHTEIIVSEEEMFNAIPEVIKSIESYDTTTVRASIGNYLLGKYIKEHSNAKVIFNGDGSDELCGGYLYMHKCPDMIEFDKETKRLLKDIHLYDVLRSDKCISSHGLEPRTPFLDKSFVNFYLSIPLDIRFHVLENNCEKFLLRKSFSDEYYLNSEEKRLLPNEILWRTKEAFSDGVSNHGRSLYEIIQEMVKPIAIEKQILDKNYTNKHLPPNKDNYEQYYYRDIFESYYPNLENIIPYFWMPKYVNATDASARTLDIYKEINSKNE
jgi:asparagine synthase (glutamine-hydrolysing)